MGSVRSTTVSTSSKSSAAAAVSRQRRRTRCRPPPQAGSTSIRCLRRHGLADTARLPENPGRAPPYCAICDACRATAGAEAEAAGLAPTAAASSFFVFVFLIASSACLCMASIFGFFSRCGVAAAAVASAAAKMWSRAGCMSSPVTCLQAWRHETTVDWLIGWIVD